ncbi:helix-turn-helix transcriptional regulator [Actinokineospora globicatena]|nr:helix-turn-helix transcriptional regulator [Actinokineospora globicatena]
MTSGMLARGLPALRRAEDVVRAARVHVAVLWRDGVLPLTPRATVALLAEVADRGVSVQVLCARDNAYAAAELAVADPGKRAIEVQYAARGLPDAIVVDHRIAVFPPTLADDAPAAVLRHSGVVSAARELFTTGWRAAALAHHRTPLDPLAGAELHQEILALLGQGHTDDTAARKLGVSVRTYRRHVATIMRTLGADSRFQAGALARERGLV